MGIPGRSRRAWLALAAGLLASAPAPARAFEFADGRVQVHGFYEAQIRSLVRDYEMNDGWDLTQWYNVLNVEVDWDVAPDGFGPFDLVSAFGRVEVRYDCVWTHACTLFDSANAYGTRSRFGGDPRRLMDAKRSGYTYQAFTGDTRHYYGLSPEQRANHYDANGILPPSPNGGRVVMPLSDVPGFEGLFGVTGQDQILGTNPTTGIDDDPAPFYFSFLRHCFFGVQRIGGTESDHGARVLPHNVDENECDVKPLGTLLDKPNPFNPNDSDPVVLPNGGAFAQPFRPFPLFTSSGVNVSDPSQVYSKAFARGVYYPNANLASLVGKHEFDTFDQNFTQDELEWNHGASQQQTKELKELFAEFEMFDSRLYVRAGKQQIVWGKTELFRTTDQFNPQDLGLGSLTSLEESRIALWSLKGIYSFYEVGPLEDVRLELGVNVDDFEPSDLGRCGEPYSPLPVCDLTYGLMAHGLAGVAIAGMHRPPHPWDSTQGFEVGARLEFRWDRFSFALVDFYGYDDFFWLDQNFVYSRNVDPQTGRPRHTMATGSCSTGAEPSCLQGVDDDPSTPLPPNNALQFHSVNQQIFAMICATSIGFSDLDPSACGQSVFNSQNKTDPPTVVTIGTAVSNLLAGDSTGLVFGGLLGVPIPGGPCNPGDVISNTLCNPLIPLSNDVTSGGVDLDGPPLTFAEAVAAGLTPTPVDGAVLYRTGLQGVLTDEQEALLGCGPFYGTFCDGNGIDLLNAEASALLQSLMGFEGTPVAAVGAPNFPLTTDPTLIQPGTIGFEGGPVCTRFQNGQLVILPGCRGLLNVGADGQPDTLDAILAGTSDDTFQDGYNPVQDGTTTSAGPSPATFPAQPRTQPFTDQFFSSEMSILSWNAVMALVALSSPPDSVDLETPVDFDGDGTLETTISVGTLLLDTNGDGVSDTSPMDRNRDGITDPEFIAQDEFDPNQPFRTDGCSFAVPVICSNVSAFNDISGLQRNTVLAGGTTRFGRRDFVWHGGSEVVLRFDKRNVLGWSLDFAEDVTKTNWGVEFTWIPGVPTANNNELDGISETDQYNLTIAVDRPTFINFLNQNRTFFVTSQWFMRYAGDYVKGMPEGGPWSLLGILNLSTGYFQDRLLQDMTFVYDFRSNSGAVLPSIQYRFTENFSTTFGLAIFSGRTERRVPELTPISLGNRVGAGAYNAHVDNGLSLIRERDEIYLLVRYTF